MTQKPRIQRVTPEELPKVLEQLNNEQQITELAIFGPDIQITAAPEDWPQPLQSHYVFQLTADLIRLPQELLKIEQLQSLLVFSADLCDSDAKAIAENLRQLSFLNLGRNRIGYIGAQAIAENLEELTSLYLGFNRLGNDGARYISKRLNKLTLLELSSNHITDIGAKAIAEHHGKLTTLLMNLNRVGDTGACAIAEHLGQLTSLHLDLNEIGNVGARFIAKHLGKLENLSLAANLFTKNRVSEVGARFIAENLGGLISLNLELNDVGDAGAQFIAEHLGKIKSLNLSANEIGDYGAKAIAKHLSQLTSLDLSHNLKVTNIAAFGDITLLALNLANTGVADLSPLKTLIQSGLPVKWSYEWIKKPGLNVYNCSLKHPPAEIVKQGPEAVRNYFREIEAQGTDRLFEAKLLIVGEGGAGKTSLLRRMFQPEMELPKEEETTHGIDIRRYKFFINGDRSFKLNAWDFGGQQIYHATHQFFLTKRSLYVLVDDTKSDNQSIHDEGFKFWLEVVEALSEGSPLLFFQNEKGGRSKIIDEFGIKRRFINVKDFYRGNLEHPGSADGLRKAVEHFAQQLEHIGDEVPAKWVVIREKLEKLAENRPHITLDEYFAIYSKYLEFDREKALHLSQYFHDLGVFLHFQSPSTLRQTVFLQNKWVTDAVFRILDDEDVKANRGRFTVSDCDRLWADEGYASKDVELRALMERFELAYRLPDMHEETWLVPQHLSPSKPPELGDWAKTGDLVLTYRYEFLPRGLVSRLMVRMHRFVKQPDLCWSHGALFEHGDTQMLVETTTRGNEIALRSRGPEQKALLSVIAIDLDALNDSFRGLKDKVSKLVPCICKTCKGLKEPAMFEQKELIDRKNRGKLTIECPKPPEYYDVSVIELLEGMDLKLWLEKARQELLPEVEADETKGKSKESSTNRDPESKTIRIFLASSSELREDRDAFDLYFRQQNDRLRKVGLYLEIVRWENFLDVMSSTRMQNEYNEAIRKCDLFISLFKTKTGKYTEEEFDVAHQTFKNTGKPLIYTWFKQASVSTSSSHRDDLLSLWNFQTKLSGLGHYHTEYKSIEDLQKQFRDQLDKLRDEGKL